MEKIIVLISVLFFIPFLNIEVNATMQVLDHEIENFTLDKELRNISIDTNRQNLWITTADSIEVVNIENKTTIKSIEMPSEHDPIAYSQDKDRIYVFDTQNSRLYVINPQTFEKLSYPVSLERGMTISVDNTLEKIFLTGFYDESLVIMDENNFTIVPIDIFQYTAEVQVNTEKNIAYTLSRSYGIHQINLDTQMKDLFANFNAREGLFNSKYDKLFALERLGLFLQVFDSEIKEPGKEIYLGHAHADMVMDHSTDLIYSINTMHGSLTLVDVKDDKVVGSIPLFAIDPSSPDGKYNEKIKYIAPGIHHIKEVDGVLAIDQQKNTIYVIHTDDFRTISIVKNVKENIVDVPSKPKLGRSFEHNIVTVTSTQSHFHGDLPEKITYEVYMKSEPNNILYKTVQTDDYLDHIFDVKVTQSGNLCVKAIASWNPFLYDEEAKGTITTESCRLVTPDTESPTIYVPDEEIIMMASSKDGETVPFEVTAKDNIRVAEGPTCKPKSNSLFPIGTHVVTCVATDEAGNEGNARFVIRIVEPEELNIDNCLEKDQKSGEIKDICKPVDDLKLPESFHEKLDLVVSNTSNSTLIHNTSKALEEEFTKLNEKADSLEEKNQKLLKDIDELKIQVDSKTEEILELNKEIGKIADEKTEEILDKNEALTVEIEGLKTDNAEEKKTNRDLQTTLNIVTKVTNSTSNEVVEISADLDKAEIERDIAQGNAMIATFLSIGLTIISIILAIALFLMSQKNKKIPKDGHQLKITEHYKSE